MNSMTGYGDATERCPEFSIQVRISSVNRKHFDIRLSLTRELAFLEPHIRSTLRDAVQRGHLTVSVDLKLAADIAGGIPQADMAVARGYLSQIEALRDELGLSGDLTLRDLALLPDVLKLRSRELTEDDLRPIADQALRQALAAFQAMRTEEGLVLKDDIAARRDTLAGHLAEIQTRAPSQPEQYRERLNSRMRDLVDGMELDAERIAKEVAIYAERCDITEEMVRLESHLEQLGQLLQATEPVGRKLDFLMQEVNREINTIGSKSVDRDISGRVIEMKTELDRMREQAQNIE